MDNENLDWTQPDIHWTSIFFQKLEDKIEEFSTRNRAHDAYFN